MGSMTTRVTECMVSFFSSLDVDSKVAFGSLFFFPVKLFFQKNYNFCGFDSFKNISNPIFDV